MLILANVPQAMNIVLIQLGNEHVISRVRPATVIEGTPEIISAIERIAVAAGCEVVAMGAVITGPETPAEILYSMEGKKQS